MALPLPLSTATHLLSPDQDAVKYRRHGPRMLCLAAMGGALEFYDFVIFVFLADVIGELFFPPNLPTWLVMVQTFGIFAAGYIFRPLGGIVLAHFGDLFGRKRVFAFSILVMAGSTLAVAFLPVYGTIGLAAPLLLVAMRICQGVALGGEVPGAWTFVAEHVSPRQTGAACGLVCVGLNLGSLLGATIVAAMTLLLAPADILSYGWRIPFLLGGLFGLIAVHLRRKLHETPVFAELRAQSMLVPELPLGVVVRTYTHGVVISILCTWILSAAVLMLTLMVPSILQGVHQFSRQDALTATSISTLSLTIGVIVAGAVLDRIGPAKLFMLGGVLLGFGDYAFYNMTEPGPVQLYLLSTIVGFSGSMAGAVPFVMVSCFPAEVRFTGVSFSFNLSYAVFGGLTPVALTAFLALNPLSHIYYLLFISALAMVLGGYFAVFPEVMRYRR
jgi:MFS family permease